MLHAQIIQVSLKSVNCQQLTAGKIEEFSSEGSSAALTCSYTKGSVEFLFWYRQNPGKHPEFLKSHSPFGGEEHLDRMTFKGSKEEMSMTISSAAVTDSAVYYWACLWVSESVLMKHTALGFS
uniref:Immunoglobulin V-set domain-containing protein n=1 Tax=Poecilia reticulata TaxID=8081 RepID=A0A3P9Q1Q0_POERE